MELSNWLVFLSIAVVATVTPGTAVFLVITHSVSAGWRKALFTVLGNITGLFLMSLCSVLGVSAILLSSTLLFTMIKVLGALYLVFMGYKLWRYGLSYKTEDIGNTRSQKRFFVQGILISLTNPKAIIFTTALFPQFLAMNSPLVPQFTVLVGTLMLCSVCCLTIYAIWGEKLLSNASGKFAKTHLISRCLGSVFIVSAMAMLISVQRRA